VVDERPRIREIKVAGGPAERLAHQVSDEQLMISKEGLGEMLGGADVIVLDLRDEIAWKESKLKVKGAMREIPSEMANWAKKYPKDQRLVIYCN